MQDIEQNIRERAYHLWLESGCQDGDAAAHWLAAQREILGDSLGELGLIAAAPPAKPKKARSPRKKQRAA